MANASRAGLGIGMQGPDAITSSRLPTTSDSTSTTKRPAWQALAKPPAFTVLAAWRTALSSWIVAPAADKKLVTAIVSSSDTPSRGATSNAEPPPVTTAMARSLGPRVESIEIISCVAATANAVGIFAPAGRVSRQWMCESGTAEPSGTLTTPVVRCRSSR